MGELKKDGNEYSEMTDDDKSKLITVQTIEEIVGVIPEDVLDQLIPAMQLKKINNL